MLLFHTQKINICVFDIKKILTLLAGIKAQNKIFPKALQPINAGAAQMQVPSHACCEGNAK